jgi:hypothetical protein
MIDTQAPSRRDGGCDPSLAGDPLCTVSSVAETDRLLETFVTLILERFDPALATAHRELYPERIPEQIPLSLTLLYPWIPRESLTDGDGGAAHRRPQPAHVRPRSPGRVPRRCRLRCA